MQDGSQVSGAWPWSWALALHPNFAPPDSVTEPLCATISPPATGDDKNSIYFIGLNEFMSVKELDSVQHTAATAQMFVKLTAGILVLEL